MMDDMRTFRTNIEVASTINPDLWLMIPDIMVDIGSEYNWISEELLAELGVAPVRVDRFETTDGRILERHVGFALLFAGGRSTATIIVFAQPGDLTLLGAIGPEGMNLRVDLARRELIPSGPLPVAAAA